MIIDRSISVEESESDKRRYIQQFGKERTGTNYLKVLLGQNFREIVLFDNRLGSKHAPYQSLGTWMESMGIAGRESFETTVQKSPYWRQRNRPSADPIERIHQPVSFGELAGLRDGIIPLHYVINIKSPYAFLVSVSRWRRNSVPVPRRLAEPPGPLALTPEEILAECQAFNLAYRSYLPLVDRGAAVIVRYEDLLQDARTVVGNLARRFGLSWRSSEFRDVRGICMPGEGLVSEPFYRDFYLRRRYLELLDDDHRSRLETTIDWRLMERYGYSKFSAENSASD